MQKGLLKFLAIGLALGMSTESALPASSVLSPQRPYGRSSSVLTEQAFGARAQWFLHGLGKRLPVAAIGWDPARMKGNLFARQAPPASVGRGYSDLPDDLLDAVLKARIDAGDFYAVGVRLDRFVPTQLRHEVTGQLLGHDARPIVTQFELLGITPSDLGGMTDGKTALFIEGLDQQAAQAWQERHGRWTPVSGAHYTTKKHRPQFYFDLSLVDQPLDLRVIAAHESAEKNHPGSHEELKHQEPTLWAKLISERPLLAPPAQAVENGEGLRLAKVFLSFAQGPTSSGVEDVKKLMRAYYMDRSTVRRIFSEAIEPLSDMDRALARLEVEKERAKAKGFIRGGTLHSLEHERGALLVAAQEQLPQSFPMVPVVGGSMHIEHNRHTLAVAIKIMKSTLFEHRTADGTLPAVVAELKNLEEEKFTDSSWTANKGLEVLDRARTDFAALNELHEELASIDSHPENLLPLAGRLLERFGFRANESGVEPIEGPGEARRPGNTIKALAQALTEARKAQATYEASLQLAHWYDEFASHMMNLLDGLLSHGVLNVLVVSGLEKQLSPFLPSPLSRPLAPDLLPSSVSGRYTTLSTQKREALLLRIAGAREVTPPWEFRMRRALDGYLLQLLRYDMDHRPPEEWRDVVSVVAARSPYIAAALAQQLQSSEFDDLADEIRFMHPTSRLDRKIKAAREELEEKRRYRMAREELERDLTERNLARLQGEATNLPSREVGNPNKRAAALWSVLALFPLALLAFRAIPFLRFDSHAGIVFTVLLSLSGLTGLRFALPKHRSASNRLFKQNA